MAAVDCAQCSICGETWHTWDLRDINTGRRHQLICPDCWEVGERQAKRIDLIKHYKDQKRKMQK